jgi:hypothetical protein
MVIAGWQNRGTADVAGYIESAMKIRWVKYVVVIVALVTVYYFLASMLIGNMPYASMPSWWIGNWPSRRVALFTWFGANTTAATFIAATPIALLLRFGTGRHRMRIAFAVGAATAAAATVALLSSENSPLSSAPAVSVTVWLDSLEHFLLLLLTVPFLVWVTGALPFNHNGWIDRQHE